MTTILEISEEIRQMAADTDTVPVWAFRQALEALRRIEASAAAGLAEIAEAQDMAYRAGYGRGHLKIARIQASTANEVLSRFLPD